MSLTPSWAGTFRSHQHLMALDDQRISSCLGTAMATLTQLISHADFDGIAQPTVKEIAAGCGLSVRTVNAHLQTLRLLGVIQVRSYGLPARGRRNRYTLARIETITERLPRLAREVVRGLLRLPRKVGAHLVALFSRSAKTASCPPETKRRICVSSSSDLLSIKTEDTKDGTENAPPSPMARPSKKRQETRRSHETTAPGPDSVPEAVWDALQAGLGWKAITDRQRSAWTPDLVAYLEQVRDAAGADATATALAHITAFFADGWWTTRTVFFKPGKLAAKFDAWYAAGGGRAPAPARTINPLAGKVIPGEIYIPKSMDELNATAPKDYCRKCARISGALHRDGCTTGLGGTVVA